MSWRERYKNNEGRFDHHIKMFQQKNRLSRRAVPIGFEAMFTNGMDDLDDFGTDEEEEGRPPQGKPAARADSNGEGEGSTRVQSRPVSKSKTTPKQPTSKRKRASDANDRTSKRTRVVEERSGGEDEAMNQDSQGEETLEVEQNLFCQSDEDSSAAPRWVPHFRASPSGFTST